MEEDYEVANARAWDTTIRDSDVLSPSPPSPDETGWQVVSRQKKVIETTLQDLPSHPPPAHAQNQQVPRRPPVQKRQNPLLDSHELNRFSLPGHGDSRQLRPLPGPSKPSDHRGRAPGQRRPIKKAVPLISEEDNAAQTSWRKQEPPIDKVRIPANLAVEDTTWESIAAGLGTFMHTSDMKFGHGHGPWTFGIWGESSAVATTKAAILAHIKEACSSQMATASRRFPKTVSLTPVLRARHQKRWEKAVKLEQYRRMPPANMGFGAIGSFHWPAADYRPEEVLGRNLEALDPIRMARSCYIVRADDGRLILQVMGNGDDVGKVLRALKTTCFQVAARSIEPVRLYLLRWPTSTRGTHVYLEPYLDPKTVPPASDDQQTSQSPRSEGYHAGPEEDEEAHLSSSMSTERACSTLESTLRQITTLQGSIQLRIRLGMFLLSRFQRLVDGDMYELAAYNDMTSLSQFQGGTTQEIGEEHVERGALSTLQGADHLLTPQSAQQHSLLEVLPVFSADFVFANDAGDLHLSMQWHMAANTNLANPEIEAGGVNWTRLDIDSGEANKLVDINLTDLQNGSTWTLELSTEKPVCEDKIPPNLLAFVEKAKISYAAVKRQDPLQPFVFYTPHPALRWLRQKIIHRYGIVDTDYTLELSNFQDFKLVAGQAHETVEPRWGLEVYRTVWDSNLAKNQNLEIGKEVKWSEDLEEWFPRDLDGPDAKTEDSESSRDGFRQLMKKLTRVEALVRGISDGGS